MFLLYAIKDCQEEVRTNNIQQSILGLLCEPYFSSLPLAVIYINVIYFVRIGIINATDMY